MMRRCPFRFCLPVSIIFILIFPKPALTCGTIDTWIAIYNGGKKHKALFHLLDCADNYKAPSDDIMLLPVIKDALKGSSQVVTVATQVFMHYNHLWGARHEPAYADVFKAITGLDDRSGFLNYDDWMVVTALRCAYMRDHASLNGKVITAVKCGMQVRALSRHGEWIKVRPVGPGSLDPRFERKVGYIHESLLRPY